MKAWMKKHYKKILIGLYIVTTYYILYQMIVELAVQHQVISLMIDHLQNLESTFFDWMNSI